MWPICSEPVTLGGGMTMENTGRGGFGIGTKQLLLHPGAGPALLDLLRFVRFGDLSWHIVSDSLLRASAVARLNRRLALSYPSPLRGGLG